MQDFLRTKLTPRAVKFVLTDKFEALFQELKKRLTVALILIVPLKGLGYAVYYDASWGGLGCVLMQQDCAVALSSRQLKTHELNYSTYDLELEAVIHALKA